MRSTLGTTLLLALAFAPALARAEQKLAVVDLQRAAKEVDEGKAATAILKKDFDEKQKQLDAKRTEFEKLQAELEKQAVVMSDAAKKEKARDLERRARELQGLYVQLQGELSEREAGERNRMLERMFKIVAELADAEGFALVLEKNAAVVYSAASLDLTSELIRKYNARHPVGPGAKKPDAKPAAPGGAAKPNGKAAAPAGTAKPDAKPPAPPAEAPKK